ncbi:hypothetical protein X975_26366, partial [Stegodyphus mimosarum]
RGFSRIPFSDGSAALLYPASALSLESAEYYFLIAVCSEGFKWTLVQLRCLDVNLTGITKVTSEK